MKIIRIITSYDVMHLFLNEEKIMENKIAIILAILLLLITIFSTVFYFGRLKVSFIEWLFFNPCAISNIVFLIGLATSLFTGNKTLIYIAILPMLFFGTLGMFFLPWNGMNIIPQIGHIIMTLNIAWSIYGIYKLQNYQSATTGLFAGIIIFSIFIAIQQSYVREHPEDFKRILIDATAKK